MNLMTWIKVTRARNTEVKTFVNPYAAAEWAASLHGVLSVEMQVNGTALDPEVIQDLLDGNYPVGVADENPNV